jgi:hypothetical protein
MLLHKLKTAAGVLLVGLLAAGVVGSGWLAHLRGAEKPAAVRRTNGETEKAETARPPRTAEVLASSELLPPPAPVSDAPVAPRKLDEYLRRWVEEMRKVETLVLEVKRQDKDRMFETTSNLIGTACFKRTGTGSATRMLGMLELRQEGKQDLAEKYVYTRTRLYSFEPTTKAIRSFDLPRPREDSYIGCFFGMRPEMIKRHYDMTLVKEDDRYVYIGLLPGNHAYFERARLVLHKDTFLIRQFWFEQPNGNETLWDFPRARKNLPLDERSFGKPALPAGWKMVEVPQIAEP